MTYPIITTIKQIYNKQTYFAKYGGQIWFAIIIITMISTLSGYFLSMGKIKSAKGDWAKYRCDPGWMPFAGAMNDDNGKSDMEYTEDNFSYCVESIINSITQVFLEPFYLAANILEETISQMAEAFGSIGGIFDTIRQFLQTFLSAIMQIILNILLVFRGVLSSINQLFIRLLGVNNVITNMGKAVGNTASSTVSTIVIIIIEIIVAGLLLAIGMMYDGISLMAGFFTFVVGIVLLVSGLTLLIIFIILLLVILGIMPIADALLDLSDVF